MTEGLEGEKAAVPCRIEPVGTGSSAYPSETCGERASYPCRNSPRGGMEISRPAAVLLLQKAAACGMLTKTRKGRLAMPYSNLSENHEKQVLSDGREILRAADAASPEIFRFLRFLIERGLPAELPLSLDRGREHYRYVQAEMVHPGVWRDDALFAVGTLLRALHDAGREYVPQDASRYRPWCLREIGGKERIWCHGDVAPWNLLTMRGMPFLLVDWEYAGPLDPLTELARVLWLFPQLHDDDVARLQGLPSPERRAAQMRVICDGYRLPRAARADMLDRIIEVIVCETAHEAIDARLAPESEGSLWGFAWRTRSLYWIFRHRRLLRQALE